MDNACVKIFLLRWVFKYSRELLQTYSCSVVRVIVTLTWIITVSMKFRKCFIHCSSVQKKINCIGYICHSSPINFPPILRGENVRYTGLEIIGPSNNTRCINVTPRFFSLFLFPSFPLTHLAGIIYGLESASLRFIGVYIINCRVVRLSSARDHIYIYSHFLGRWFAVSGEQGDPICPRLTFFPLSFSCVACAWHFKDSP